MPLFDYSCRACGHVFEALVRGKKAPVCPSCESVDLERLLALPSVRSESTRAQAMRAAKKRDAKQADDRVRAQREYELSHND
jgi:putative FmdB family regulatory protein